MIFEILFGLILLGVLIPVIGGIWISFIDRVKKS